MFKTATKTQSKLRLALIGPSGSGKTFTALSIAQHLGKRVAVIDTERGSASKYSDSFQFDVAELPTHNPENYISAIQCAERDGYDVLVIDSLSHAWSGKDGALEQVDRAAKRSQSGNTYTAWRDVTPLHNRLVDAMLLSTCHVIVTMRAKTEYVLETNERGKQVPRKVGLAPIQRDGVEYEFDVAGDLTLDHDLLVSKTRCAALDGAVIQKPGKQLAETLKQWLTDGVPAPEPKEPEPEETFVSSLLDSARAVDIPDKYFGTYLKKKWNGDIATEEQFTTAFNDISVVGHAIAERIGCGEAITEDFLKAQFREVCK